MVRVAGLKGQVRAGVSTPSQDGLTPAQQLAAITLRATRLMEEQQRCWRGLKARLRAPGIVVATPNELSAQGRQWRGRPFMGSIFPGLTPLAIHPAPPLPFPPPRGFSLLARP